MARVRTDMALTIAVAALVGLGAQQITTKVIESTNRPAEYMAVEITDGTIGAQAESGTYRAGSIAEIKTQDGLFTVVVEDIRDYQSVGSTDDFYTLKLQSGEQVMARVLKDSIVREQDEENSSAYYAAYHYVMPIGQLVNEPVPDSVMQALGSYHTPPDDSSFYIDMRGAHKAGTQYNPKDAKKWGENVFMLTTIIVFTALWNVLVKVGLFPPMFPRRSKREEAPVE